MSEVQVEALERIRKSGATTIIGVDEVGLGSWAGPLVVAAVAVPYGWSHKWVTDSKRIDHQKRVRALTKVIYPTIKAKCLLSHDSTYIDTVGVGTSLEQLTEAVALFCLTRFPDAIVVLDGEPKPIYGVPPRRLICLPKADRFVPAVSAASILAKVSRDMYMREQAKNYPHYDFENNVGYHSLSHRRGLEKYGPCPLHRKSYRPIKEYLRSGSW